VPRDPALSESMKPENVRRELHDAVDLVLAGGLMAAAAEAVTKAAPAGLPGSGAIAAAILRAAVEGTLRELRVGRAPGAAAGAGAVNCAGFSVAQCAALLAAVDERREPPAGAGGASPARGGVHLARVLLQLVADRICDPVVVPPAADNTSPSTVDTPQPSPATPDSICVAPRAHAGAGGGGDDTAERQDAVLALVAACLARGLLLWEDVERTVKECLNSNLDTPQLLSRLMFSFVEFLLTDRREGAGRMLLDTDWARVCSLRATQPTLKEVYLILKYLLQMQGTHPQECVQRVVQDPGFGRIVTCDEPGSFMNDLLKPCKHLWTHEGIEQPFRTFSYAPASRVRPPAGAASRDDALGLLRAVMSRRGRCSPHHDAVEIKNLADSWKDVQLADGRERLPDMVDGVHAADGWRLMASAPRVDAAWVAAFESACEKEALQGLRDAFRRRDDQAGPPPCRVLSETSDPSGGRSNMELTSVDMSALHAQVMEHEVVHHLLASLWRAPADAAQVCALPWILSAVCCLLSLVCCLLSAVACLSGLADRSALPAGARLREAHGAALQQRADGRVLVRGAHRRRAPRRSRLRARRARVHRRARGVGARRQPLARGARRGGARGRRGRVATRIRARAGAVRGDVRRAACRRGAASCDRGPAPAAPRQLR
jgi:hypothetical protein